MNKEIKAQWLAALRSGKYTQGHSYLHAHGRHCCLGVLCELAVEAGVIKAGTPDTEGVFLYGKRKLSGWLPNEVKKWAGITPAGGHEAGSGKLLATVNDKHCDGVYTAPIAAIEEHL